MEEGVAVKVRIATRKSRLALVQTRWVAARMREGRPDLEIEEVSIVTEADKILDRPLTAIGGKGLFVSEVEGLVVRGEADIAVHSLKDVPGDVDLPEGLDLICIPAREDPHDVLITRDGSQLDDLSAGARVGTTSLRRISQLSAHRPDLQYATLRGNVGTRLERLQEGKFDAIVLAAAGLRRLDLLETVPHQVLPIEVCMPAVGQGTLAIEGRVDDAAILELLAPLEDADTRIRTEAERALLRRLMGSCRVPISGHAQLTPDRSRLRLDGLVGSLDGARVIHASAERYVHGRSREALRDEARALGEEVAATLLARGADALMREAEATVLQREREAERSR
ncbi:MAG: hydroxymethylbilane synthase [Polyangiaceae bacterium]|nr:hydroxymethylbilane synthase [Polyangiaceae bacterium]